MPKGLKGFQKGNKFGFKSCSFKGKILKKNWIENIRSAKLGNKNPLWKIKSNYKTAHRWIKTHFGKANKCENKYCENKINKFEWSQIHNTKNDRKRENFWMLCRYCHHKYDKHQLKGWKTRKLKKIKLYGKY